MKKIIVLFAIMLGLSSAAFAQSLLLGPSLTFKGGINGADIPEGQKTAVNVNFFPDINATLKYLFSKESSVGLLFDLGYNSATYRMRPENESVVTDNNTLIYNSKHLVLAPSLFMSGFYLGAAFGIPMGSNTSNVSGSIDESADNTDGMNSPYIEARIGGMITAMKNETGALNIIVMAGYNLNGLASGDVMNNPKPVTFGIGVNYLFALVGRP